MVASSWKRVRNDRGFPFDRSTQSSHAKRSSASVGTPRTRLALSFTFSRRRSDRFRKRCISHFLMLFLCYFQDEIACSFSNRNEIHLFNLQKFPTKPHRVLKAMSPPSSGYNDIVFLPANATHQAPGGNATPRSSLIGGDMNGTVRMWDPKIPTRPIWSVSTGSHPVNALVLSPTKQYLVCGTESGFITVRRVCHYGLNGP